jgi:hypothetical protein
MDHIWTNYDYCKDKFLSYLKFDKDNFDKTITILQRIYNNDSSGYFSHNFNKEEFNLLILVHVIIHFNKNNEILQNNRPGLKSVKDTIDLLRFVGIIKYNDITKKHILTDSILLKIELNNLIKLFLEKKEFCIKPNYKPKKLFFE